MYDPVREMTVNLTGEFSKDFVPKQNGRFPAGPGRPDRAVSAKHHGDFIQITESILTRDWILAAIPTIIAYLTKPTVYYMIYEYPTVVLT